MDFKHSFSEKFQKKIIFLLPENQAIKVRNIHMYIYILRLSLLQFENRMYVRKKGIIG